MANYKPDIENKLNNEKEALLRNVPEFLYIYVEEVLTSRSNELRSHIANAKDIINFLKYYSTQVIHKELSEITLLDINNTTLRNMNNYFKYITEYKITYKSTLGKDINRTRTNSTSSKSRKLASIKNFYKYLEDNKLITNNPTKSMEIVKPEITKLSNKLDPLSIVEIEKEILKGDNISTDKEKKAYDRLKLRDLTIFLIVSFTGIRVSELVSLDISDVNVNECTVKVVRKNNKIQEIPYPEEVSKYIEEYLVYRDKLNPKVNELYKKALFLSQQSKRITDQSVRIMLKKYCDRLHIDNIACHTFRRTFISTLYNRTGDIKLAARIGGHSVATASKYYADVDEDRYRNVVRSFKYK